MRYLVKARVKVAAQRHTFEFTFNDDKEAHAMFIKQETGTVDLAGLGVRETK